MDLLRKDLGEQLISSLPADKDVNEIKDEIMVLVIIGFGVYPQPMIDLTKHIHP